MKNLNKITYTDVVIFILLSVHSPCIEAWIPANSANLVTAVKIAEQVICLPIYPSLDVEYTIKKIVDIIN